MSLKSKIFFFFLFQGFTFQSFATSYFYVTTANNSIYSINQTDYSTNSQSTGASTFNSLIVNPSGTTGYLNSSGSSSLYSYDLSTLLSTSSVSAPTAISSSCSSPNGSKIYGTSTNGNVWYWNIGDPSTNLITTVPGLTSAPITAVDPTNNYLLLRASVLSTKSLVYVDIGNNSSITYSLAVGGITFDRSGHGYATNLLGNTLTRINLSTHSLSTLDLGAFSGAIARFQVGASDYLLVQLINTYQVAVIDCTSFTVAATINLASTPSSIIVNPVTPSIVYILEPTAQKVQSLDFTSSITSPSFQTLNLSGFSISPTFGAPSASGQLLFVSTGSSSLAVLALSGAFLGYNTTITLDGAPKALASGP